MIPDTPVTQIFRLDEFQKKALAKLRIHTARDLLYHFPARYGDTSEMRNIATLEAGETAAVFGKISRLKISKGFRTKISMATAVVEDESGRIQCVWFNQPYLAKMTPEGAFVRIEGKVSRRRTNEKELYFSNPKLETVGKLPAGGGDSLFGKEGAAHTLYPIYPESRGITSNWIYHSVQRLLKDTALAKNLSDPIPAEIIKKYNIPSLRTAMIWIHSPMKKDDAEVARKRFAFEEIFFIQLEKRLARRTYEENPAWNIKPEKVSLERFIARFPFEMTTAQRHAADVILSDFTKGHAMSRLLEGDVGSGKTAVAAVATYAAVTAHRPGIGQGRMENPRLLQVAYMCPTEILAIQHFESFIQYFSHLGIRIGLITGAGCRKFPSKTNPKGWTDISRTQLLKWVADGDISVLIGTHALIQKSIKFKNLAFVIIDEQHRFGTNQRAELVRKEAAQRKGKTLGTRNPAGGKSGSAAPQKVPLPHFLSMTATPIPRTLALTIYGDLDLTLLDQMPAGRKSAITVLVPPTERDITYEKIRTELKGGRQAYVICPRIDEAEADRQTHSAGTDSLKSVTEEARRLKEKIFPEYSIGVLHGKMKSEEKDRVMLDFKAGKTDILCATSVVEVGVNVPNATVIVIESSERFGLAQLHQLRGRVIRSHHQAYCYLFTGSGNANGGTNGKGTGTRITGSEKTLARMKALTTAKNGFELAEYDLAQRGAGALSGGKQWGISDIAMEALKNIKMVEAARTEAQVIVDTDPAFGHIPLIAEEIGRRRKKTLHFE